MRRKFLSFFMLLTAIFATTLSVEDIDKKVDEIKSPRKGMDMSLFDKASDPFIYYDKNKTTGAYIIPKAQAEDENATKLNSIMGSKAYIGGSWKRVGDMAGKYKIVKIETSAVLLSYKNRIKKIGLAKKANLIKF